MIKEQDFNDKQKQLYETMSEISEDCYCAGWISDNEYNIWYALQGGARDGWVAEIDGDLLETCRVLAKDLDGWIVWWDDDMEPGLPGDDWGPRFVSTSEWMAMIATSKPVDIG